MSSELRITYAELKKKMTYFFKKQNIFAFCTALN